MKSANTELCRDNYQKKKIHAKTMYSSVHTPDTKSIKELYDHNDCAVYNTLRYRVEHPATLSSSQCLKQ